MKRAIYPIYLLLFLAGCMSDEACRYYLKENLPPKDVTEVDVLYKAPITSYTVIADFQAYNASVKHMRKRAAEIGADAVIVVPAGGWYSEKEVWADKGRGARRRMILTAICPG